MAIRHWHYGQLILLWAWGAVISSFTLYVLATLSPDRYIIGSGLIVIAIAIPAVLSIATWKWLSAKEGRGD